MKEMLAELRKKTDVDLLGRREELKRELFLVRSAGVTGAEKPSSKKMRECRREIAQILTILRERELQESFREPLL